LIFIPQENSPLFTKGLLAAPAKSAGGFRVGSGKYGLILIMYVAHHTEMAMLFPDVSQQVSLSPARRSYLEYKFGTVSQNNGSRFLAGLILLSKVKSYNGRNRFILPFIVRMFVHNSF
jgi:hypothetical protein